MRRDPVVGRVYPHPTLTITQNLWRKKQSETGRSFVENSGPVTAANWESAGCFCCALDAPHIPTSPLLLTWVQSRGSAEFCGTPCEYFFFWKYFQSKWSPTFTQHQYRSNTLTLLNTLHTWAITLHETLSAIQCGLGAMAPGVCRVV